MNLQQFEQFIPNLTGVATLIIAVCSFLLSFFNLQATALDAGIIPWLSWLWPVCIDALLISGSLMILRSSIRMESTMVGWTVLIVFTLISMVFNIIHSPPDIISQAAHAVAPVTLCVSIELFMMCIRSDLSTEQVIEQVPTAQIVEVLNNGEPVTKTEVVHVSLGTDPEKFRQVMEYFEENPESTISEAAKVLGISRTTITKYRNEGRNTCKSDPYTGGQIE